MLAGCASYSSWDKSWTVQDNSTVFGIDVAFFDLMAGGTSPQKVRLGYINNALQITPQGESSHMKKTYTDVPLAGEITTELNVNATQETPVVIKTGK